jgi:SAM-dependent methyltransferase
MYRPWITALGRGEPALHALEKTLVGDVTGQRLLHVPCHIGHDTLSWALLGARVTGVDFSTAALEEARRLAAELDLRAEWVEADAQALPTHLDGRFDVAVATYGAVGWMEDLPAFVRGVYRCLAPGGRFVVVDGHPVALGLEEHDGTFVVRDPIMGGDPVEEDRPGSYAGDIGPTVHDRHVGWCHGVGEIVTALLDAGFVVDHLAEHDHLVWQQFPSMVPRDGAFVLPPPWHGRIPLLLSVRARRPS